MARIATRVDVRSTAYAENRAAMLDALAEIDGLTAQVVRGGGSGDAAKDARSVAKLRGRGKLLPRERIGLLLDRWPAGAPTTRSAAAWSPASDASTASSA